MESDFPLVLLPMTLGTPSDWRWTLSWRVLVRPMKKKRAPARARTTTPPIAIPAIAPTGRPLLCDEDDGVAVAAAEVADEVLLDEDVEEILDAFGVEDSSGGKSSPGWSINAESLAICFCVARLTDAFLTYGSARMVK